MLRDVAAVADRDEEWQRVLQQHIDRMKSGFDTALGLEREAAPADSAWVTSLEAWRQAFLFMPPDEILGGVQGEQLRQLSERLLALPPLGPFREQYAALQQGARLWQAYQDKCRAYRGVFYRLGKQALDRLQEKILAMGRNGQTIDSLRQLYGLWVESNDEVFSRYAASEEYSVLYGELVGAFMEFRRYSLTLLEDMFRQLDLPSSRSVGSLGREQKALYEALRNSREEQQQLRSTVEELRREVERLRGGMKENGDGKPKD
jgi:class III poly(R)-hydroxyalkanoic acid synthase PhaE subunit